MTTSTTGGRALAIAASLSFTAGGLFILLGDTITKPGQWTIYHALTVLTVFGTVAAGHLTSEARRSRRWLAMLGFAMLFLAGTGLVVYSSVGRQAETSETSTLSAEATNKAIADKGLELGQARQRLADAEAEVAFELAGRPDKKTGKPTVKPGCGKNCEDWKTRSKEVQSRIRELEGEITKLGPQKPVNPEAQQMAKIAALFGANEAKAAAILILVKPFFWTLFFEVGSIVSIGYAFGDKPKRVSPPANENRPQPLPEPKTRARKSRVSRTKKDETIVAFVDEFRKRHGRDPTYPEMRSRFQGIAKSTAHRYQRNAA